MNKNTFIIAEDNPRDREFLHETLSCIDQNSTSTIRIASSGEEALELALQEKTPMVVSDIQMQSMSGIELARQLWQKKPQTRLILWTNYSDEIYLRSLQKVIPPGTVYGYILKNKPSDVIIKAASTVFNDGQSWIDPEIRHLQARTQEKINIITDAEFEVLIDIALGLTDNLIAKRRALSRRGVQNRLKSLYAKLGVDSLSTEDEQILNSRSRAVNIALQRGLLNSHELDKEERKMKEWLKASRD